MQLMTVAAGEQNLGVYSVAHHVWCAPLAGEERVESEVPPEIVRELLGPTIELPLPEDVEALVIHDEDATGTVAAGSAERAHQDSVGTAMDGVRRCVSSARGQRLRLDHF